MQWLWCDWLIAVTLSRTHAERGSVNQHRQPLKSVIIRFSLLIESITYVEVFPETIIIIIVSSSPVCFIAHCIVSIEIECSIVVLINTSSEYTLNAAKVSLCENWNAFIVFPLSLGKNDEEKKQKKKPIAINNCHFTDSPTPSIYLSATYTTPYLYCRSFNKNKNDRSTERRPSTEWIRTKTMNQKKKKMTNSDDFFLFSPIWIWSLHLPSPSISLSFAEDTSILISIYCGRSEAIRMPLHWY